jgi:hypothetical protein
VVAPNPCCDAARHELENKIKSQTKQMRKSHWEIKLKMQSFSQKEEVKNVY